MRTPQKLLLGAVSVAGALAVSFSLASRRQQRTLTAIIERLRTQGRSASGRRHAVSSRGGDPETLPAPVARYLRWALGDDSDLQEVRLTQTGWLRTDVHSDRWMAFEAEHLVVPSAPGFVWNARVAVAPLVHVRVTDALIDGRGSGHVAILSAFTVQEAGGTLEMDSGSLHRYLAEAVWYPVALRPGPQLRWTAIDDGRALATLTSGAVTVSLEFRFAATGEVTGIYTPARWGTFAGGYRQVPWEGHFRHYQERDGMRVPIEGDVGWYVDDVWRPVWEGRITAYSATSR